MKKFIRTAEMRELEMQVTLGEISYSRMIELLNEKADAWHQSELEKLNKSDAIKFVCEHINTVAYNQELLRCVDCDALIEWR